MKNRKTNIKHKIQLKWKKLFGEHRAFSWHESKIKELDWVYGVEANYRNTGYTAWLVMSKHAEPITLIRKPVPTQEHAEIVCEEHLINFCEKLQTFIKSNKLK